MNFAEWTKDFLSKNNRELLKGNLLDSVEGAPLYAYKMSTEEYKSLQDCLKLNIDLYLSTYDINQICQKSAYFPQLFVLFASMWWQREYDGTGMSWEPIFHDAGIDYTNLDSNIRSEMIKSGFFSWNLVLNNNIGNLRFIGNIASQGGLPLKLIASDRNGSLNRLLKRVLKDAVGLSFPDQSSISSLIESHQNELPKSYRQPIIFSLLAEIIITFVYLKKEANLDNASNPIEKLNQFNSNWRDSFPLPMDDENARGVLERFIQEGVKVRAEKQNFSISLDRHIRFDGQTFKIISEVKLPRQSEDEDSIKRAFDIQDDFITRVMVLQVGCESNFKEITIRRLAGQNSYRFDIDTKLTFEDSTKEHIATLKNTENKYRNINLHNGYELDDDTPWIFDADENNEDKLLKIGAGKFKSENLYVVVPSDYELSNAADIKASMHGSSERICYLINTETAFTSRDGEIYLICPNKADAIEDDYALYGSRIWHVFQSPSLAFIGHPKITKFSRLTNTFQNSPISTFCKNLNGKPLNGDISIFGPLDIVVKEGINSVWASKIAVLPSTAKYNIKPSEDINVGIIELVNWRLNNLKCLTEGVTVKAEFIEGITQITCTHTNERSPNEFINLELFWPDNPKTAVIKLPFPSAGVMAFDEFGNRINKRKPLSLNRIYGVRIVTMLHQSNNVEITLSLKDTGILRVDPTTIRLKSEINHSRIEIRLIDFKEQIIDLLYALDNLDSKVEFRVSIAGAQDFILYITKYDVTLTTNAGTYLYSIESNDLQNFEIEDVENCEVLSTRLDDIDDAITLKQSHSHGVSNAIWEFPSNKYTEGTWLIHPSSVSAIRFRPMVLGFQNKSDLEQDASFDSQHTPSLKEALRNPNSIERSISIEKVINSLVEDFNHKDWSHIEYLAKNLGHIELASLDIWRFFAKNKKAMSALALRDCQLPESFIQRFSSELPFMWEFVSMEEWLDSAFYLKKQVFQKWSTSEDYANQYFNSVLSSKLDYLLANNPSLRVCFEYIKYKNGLAISQDMQLLLTHPNIIESNFYHLLFVDEMSELQKLLRNDSDNWPIKYIDEIRSFKSSDHKELMCIDDFGIKDGVINLPLIFAVSMMTNDYPSWAFNDEDFLEVKRIKNFDADWFASAFDMTVARAITKGYVN